MKNIIEINQNLSQIKVMTWENFTVCYKKAYLWLLITIFWADSEYQNWYSMPKEQQKSGMSWHTTQNSKTKSAQDFIKSKEHNIINPFTYSNTY